MSKAILVMDMPSSCSECQLLVGFIGKEIAICTGTTSSKKYNYPNGCRPSYCPLREVPQKKGLFNQLPKYDTDIHYEQGYNACIDEILGGGE